MVSLLARTSLHEKQRFFFWSCSFSYSYVWNVSICLWERFHFIVKLFKYFYYSLYLCIYFRNAQSVCGKHIYRAHMMMLLMKLSCVAVATMWNGTRWLIRFVCIRVCRVAEQRARNRFPTRKENHYSVSSSSASIACHGGADIAFSSYRHINNDSLYRGVHQWVRSCELRTTHFNMPHGK